MKTNKFDINRFWMLFSTEFIAGTKKNWISLLLISCLSLIAVLIFGIFSTIFTGHFSFGAAHIGARATYTGIYLLMVGIIFPAKLYGHINERGSSTSYLLLPASRFEKYLSMILNCVVVIPLISVALYLGIDAAICGIASLCQESSEILPGIGLTSYTPIAAVIFRDLGEFASEMPDFISLNNFSFASSASSLFFWLEVFLLGALCFKGNKSSKTLLTVILVYIVAGIVFSIFGVIATGFVDESTIENLSFRHYNLAAATAIWQIILNAAMLTAIWFRFKSLKA